MSVIEISGELNFITVPEINKRGRIFIKENANPIIDLNKVTFSDNAGVALLVSWVRYAKSIGRKVLFVNLPKQILDLIDASGLKEILPIKNIK